MSLVLRHKPEEIGLQLDANGWADVNELIGKLNTKGLEIDFDTLQKVVDTNDKKRFAFSDDKTRIRASQGHSVEVDLQMEEVRPPAVLYHGTAMQNVDNILKTGIQKQSRQYVHLSQTRETAIAVGGRHGKPVVLKIDADTMHAEGHKFYLSANNVWLADDVPAKFIQQ